MQIGREISEFKDKILDRTDTIQSDKHAQHKFEIRQISVRSGSPDVTESLNSNKFQPQR